MSDRISSDSLWFVNCHVTIHLAQAANSGRLTITEQLLPPGFGPPFHIHHEEDETFYLVDGDFRFRRGDTLLHAKAGDVVFCPKGIPHGFRVLSEGGGRCLTITRGGFEEMLRHASQPAPAKVLPQQATFTPEMLARLGAICSAHGIDLLGPPID